MCRCQIQGSAEDDDARGNERHLLEVVSDQSRDVVDRLDVTVGIIGTWRTFNNRFGADEIEDEMKSALTKI